MTRPTKILIAEDNDLSRAILARRLERFGYEILTACDGDQAVKLACAALPDLILMDLNMPVMDGWTASRTIKANDETRQIPVVALTAHALAGDRDKALAAGCDEYETKPIHFDRLRAKIKRLLQPRRDHEPEPVP